MNNENYLVIQGWMRNELGLKGNELMVYALIYGFSQDGEDEFTGSVGYISEWIGVTKQTVFNTLKSLIEKQLIKKSEAYTNGVKFCRYSILPLVKNFDGGGIKNFDRGSKKNLPNNISENKEKETIEALVGAYNNYCTRLKRKSRVTKTTIVHTRARLKEYSVQELENAFIKMNESDFCAGNNKRHWQADYDWLMKNENNVVKVLEGKYDNAMPKTERELIDAFNAIGGESGAKPYDSF